MIGMMSYVMMTLWISLVTILTAHKCPQNFKKKVVLLHILLDNDIPNAVLEILENFSFEDV